MRKRIYLADTLSSQEINFSPEIDFFTTECAQGLLAIRHVCPLIFATSSDLIYLVPVSTAAIWDWRYLTHRINMRMELNYTPHVKPLAQYQL